MRPLLKSEKNWLVILLLFVLGAVVLAVFHFVKPPAKNSPSFTKELQVIDPAPASPLGRQEK